MGAEITSTLELGRTGPSDERTLVLILFGVVWDSLKLELVANVASEDITTFLLVDPNSVRETASDVRELMSLEEGILGLVAEVDDSCEAVTLEPILCEARLMEALRD